MNNFWKINEGISIFAFATVVTVYILSKRKHFPNAINIIQVAQCT